MTQGLTPTAHFQGPIRGPSMAKLCSPRFGDLAPTADLGVADLPPEIPRQIPDTHGNRSCWDGFLSTSDESLTDRRTDRQSSQPPHRRAWKFIVGSGPGLGSSRPISQLL